MEIWKCVIEHRTPPPQILFEMKITSPTKPIIASCSLDDVVITDIDFGEQNELGQGGDY